MYYVRLFGSGLDTDRFDPRDKIFAEFKCALCGGISEIDVTTTRHSFDYARERKCPKCGLVSVADKEQNLKATLEKLTTEQSRIQVQIEKTIRELDEIKTSKEK